MSGVGRLGDGILIDDDWSLVHVSRPPELYGWWLLRWTPPEGPTCNAWRAMRPLSFIGPTGRYVYRAILIDAPAYDPELALTLADQWIGDPRNDDPFVDPRREWADPLDWVSAGDRLALLRAEQSGADT